ncbi:rhodanese-like domain-containing protein [Agaribacterium sp. ZY112]|uniref:rhodanese-like domain-containing protein n=1 Tax=Agaribacterium sp. ZY112 TaxID=3233574 RepID=UPI0035232C21
MYKKLLLSLVFSIASVSALAETVWIDVRSAGEFNSGHIEGALNIVYSDIVAGVREQGIDKDDQIMLYCRSGRRSGIATDALLQAGWTGAVNRGGYAALIEAGYKSVLVDPQ